MKVYFLIKYRRFDPQSIAMSDSECTDFFAGPTKAVAREAMLKRVADLRAQQQKTRGGIRYFGDTEVSISGISVLEVRGDWTRHIDV